MENKSTLAFWKPVLMGLAVAAVVFAVNIAADRILIHLGDSSRSLLRLSDGIAAIFAGILAAQIFRFQRERRRAMQDRVERIAEMNHHVRNALQVISYWMTAERDKREVKMVRESVDRIQWALREILARDASDGPLRPYIFSGIEPQAASQPEPQAAAVAPEAPEKTPTQPAPLPVPLPAPLAATQPLAPEREIQSSSSTRTN